MGTGFGRQNFGAPTSSGGGDPEVEAMRQRLRQQVSNLVVCATICA